MYDILNQRGEEIMKNFFKFIVIFMIIYFILSLPMILGIGVAIDFVKETSCFNKAKAYFITGIEYGYNTKLLIAIVSAIVLTNILKIKKK